MMNDYLLKIFAAIKADGIIFTNQDTVAEFNVNGMCVVNLKLSMLMNYDQFGKLRKKYKENALFAMSNMSMVYAFREFETVKEYQYAVLRNCKIKVPITILDGIVTIGELVYV